MKIKVLISILSPIILFFLLAFYKLIPVITKTFPLENTEAVLFSLTNNILGAKDFAAELCYESLLSALKISISFSFICFIFFVISKKKSFQYIIVFQILTILVVSLFLAIRIHQNLPITEYYTLWKEFSAKPSHSEFFIKEYVNPQTVSITFKDKKNLLLIFLESMEYNFQDSANGGDLKENLIPEITNYLNQYQSFKPGGLQIRGTGWTMADAVAKTCGIPLLYPKGVDGNTIGLKKFLPGAYCLTDFLYKEGYNLAFSKGAILKFASMQYFLNTHSVANAYGLFEYKNDANYNIDTTTFWGLRDSTHYEFLKRKISELDSSEKPWLLWAETVDTHTPYGVLDRECWQDIPEEKQYPYVIKCSSKQLYRFIEWAKQQRWFENTTIAVMGDHATMAAPTIVGFNQTNITHYWLNFFINPAKDNPSLKRMFSSLDMYPTLLESMGAEIEGHSLGLGRSLYSKEPTLIEKYGIDSLNKELQKKSIEYNSFLYSN